MYVRKAALRQRPRDFAFPSLAVSQAVRQLEKEAGTKLFSRTSKGVLLTREGELLYHYVKGGVEQLLEGGRMLKRMLDMDMGEVRIGASDMTLRSFYFLIWSSSTKNIRRSR